MRFSLSVIELIGRKSTQNTKGGSYRTVPIHSGASAHARITSSRATGERSLFYLIFGGKAFLQLVRSKRDSIRGWLAKDMVGISDREGS